MLQNARALTDEADGEDYEHAFKHEEQESKRNLTHNIDVLVLGAHLIPLFFICFLFYNLTFLDGEINSVIFTYVLK